MKTSRYFFLPIATLLLAVTGCSDERVVQGDCRAVFDGEICTWATMAGDQVLEIGATVPISSIEGAPMEGEMVFPPVANARIPLPADVQAQTGFDHLAVNWELHGHPPGPFLTPHFDFHFNVRSAAEIEAVDCSDPSKPEMLPAGYVLQDLEIPGMGTLVGTCVPAMGMHALPGRDAALTEPFGASMVVGYYAGETTFLEPMISRAKLLERQSFSLDVPMVEGVDAQSWPTGFEAQYDEAAGTYELVLTVGTGG